MILPDFFINQSSFFDNLKTLIKHSRFRPLRIVATSWLILALVFSMSGIYMIFSAPSSSADDSTWTFDNLAGYSYDANKVELVDGVARLKEVDQVDDDNSADGFAGGTHSGTQWSATDDRLKLNPSGRSGGSGGFISRVIDADSDAPWSAITWAPKAPYYKELPDNAQAELGYSEGNADMTGNKLLFHMNEAGGDVIDSSGQGNNGTAYGDVAYGQGGKLDSALQFDGNGDFIRAPGLVWTPTTFSVSWWIYPLSAKSFNQIIAAVGGWDAFLFHAGSGGSAYVGINASKGRFTPTDLTYGTVETNRWQHFVFTFNNRKARFYKDGVLLASKDDMPYPITWSGFQIGTSTHNSIHGKIDELAIYDRDLSANEVLDHYKRGALRLKYQARSCDDSLCSGEKFIGPDGTAATYYSELDSNKNTTPSLALTDVPSNHYFQYKTYFETDDPSYSPELQSVAVGPTHYPSNDPVIVSTTPAPSFSSINSFSEKLGKNNQGAVKYQISNDGADWYYHDGSSWIQISDDSQNNTAVEVNAKIKTFASEVGKGDFYFKAFLHSDGAQLVELEEVDIDYTLEADEEEKGPSDDEDEEQDKEEPKKEEEKQDEEQNTEKQQDKEQDVDKQPVDKKEDGEEENDNLEKENDDNQATKVYQEKVIVKDSTNSMPTTSLSVSTNSSRDKSDIINNLEEIEKKTNLLLSEVAAAELRTRKKEAEVFTVRTQSQGGYVELYEELVNITNDTKNIAAEVVGEDSTIANILNYPAEISSDIVAMKNKVLDLQAVIDNIKFLLQQGGEATTTWYTFNSVDLNILLSNPTDSARDIYYNACLPKEAKKEHILELSDGLQVENDEERECLAVSATEQLGSKESRVKNVKIEDIWVIDDNDIEIIREEASKLSAVLSATVYNRQAAALQEDIDGRLNRIVEQQEGNSMTPESHITAFRENKKDLELAKDSLGVLQALKNQTSSKNSLSAQVSRVSAVVKWGAAVVVISGFIILAFVVLAMWRHQARLVESVISLSRRNSIDTEKRN